MPDETTTKGTKPSPPDSLNTWESWAIRNIQKLHDQAVGLARELGGDIAAQGRENRSPMDICETLDEAFSDGWNEGMTSQP
jgi:hypothetical protein